MRKGGDVGNRIRYEVRVRIDGQKKSFFYNAKDSGSARDCYHGPGDVMWVRKKSDQELMGIGEFFTLGDVLLKEFAGKEGEVPKREKFKEKVRYKRFLARVRRQTEK